MFIYQKIVDRSTLQEGFQIPVEFHHMLKAMPNGMPSPGESRQIKILLDGIEYDATLKNQSFDRNKFNDHADVVQVRYSKTSPLAKRFREVFNVTWQYVEGIKQLPENFKRKMVIHIPKYIQEFIALSATDIENVFIADCITCSFKEEVRCEIQTMNELDFETFENKTDDSASIKEVTRVQKVRQLDRSIGESLKRLYDDCCQMTGEKIGKSYGYSIVEAHHIIPFTESLNNDSSNIIILSPNYHRIIHKAKPEFNREKKAFIFPNGLIEEVKLDYHLFK